MRARAYDVLQSRLRARNPSTRTLGGLAKGGNAQLYEIAIQSARAASASLQSSAEGRHNPAMSCFDLLAAAAAAAERPAESLNSPPIGKRDYHRRTRPTHTKFQKTVMGSVRG